MPDENSIATGHALTPETWADFVQRLRYHCKGQGVNWHHTAAALFTVQTQRTDFGYESDYAEGLVVCLEDRHWFSPAEYWEDLDDEDRAELNAAAQEAGDCDFPDLDKDDQWEILADLDDHTVTGWRKRWEIVNSHFTKEAAEAFIRRKQHDYGPMRVYVESQYYAWEFEAIKAAILDGRLTLTAAEVVSA